jgi:hypothetical protein
MVTTFQSRKLVRDELVALFIASGFWTVSAVNNVYGYFPSANEIGGKSPLLVILSDGTRQEMSGAWSNKASYAFRCITLVLADSDSDSWTSANAEDRLDELDRAFRQVIRSAASLTNADSLRFDEGYSERIDVNLGGKPYIREERRIFADVIKGTML